jgi:hypothetical protein
LGTNGFNLEKCVFAVPSLEILGNTISATVLALRRSYRRQRILPPPSSGHQATAMISRHGKLLLPVF